MREEAEIADTTNPELEMAKTDIHSHRKDMCVCQVKMKMKMKSEVG